MVQLEQDSRIEEKHEQNGSTATQSQSQETLSDSERTDTEIDRIIAETNMLESKTLPPPVAVLQNGNGPSEDCRLEVRFY
ncbi:hypothetical protein COOONC_15222 [Cooperia oncophora]